MILYVALVRDRHLDDEVAVFVNEADAVAWCEKTFRETVAYPDDVRRIDPTPEGYIVYLEYLPAEDEAWVMRVTARDEQ